MYYSVTEKVPWRHIGQLLLQFVELYIVAIFAIEFNEINWSGRFSCSLQYPMLQVVLVLP